MDTVELTEKVTVKAWNATKTTAQAPSFLSVSLLLLLLFLSPSPRYSRTVWLDVKHQANYFLLFDLQCCAHAKAAIIVTVVNAKSRFCYGEKNKKIKMEGWN